MRRGAQYDDDDQGNDSVVEDEEDDLDEEDGQDEDTDDEEEDVDDIQADADAALDEVEGATEDDGSDSDSRSASSDEDEYERAQEEEEQEAEEQGGGDLIDSDTDSVNGGRAFVTAGAIRSTEEDDASSDSEPENTVYGAVSDKAYIRKLKESGLLSASRASPAAGATRAQSQTRAAPAAPVAAAVAKSPALPAVSRRGELKQSAAAAAAMQAPPGCWNQQEVVAINTAYRQSASNADGSGALRKCMLASALAHAQSHRKQNTQKKTAELRGVCIDRATEFVTLFQGLLTAAGVRDNRS
jgi:hypothetical protein